ncbi:MAG: AEC family transporter, partial [Gammaproteobacteria bacterium]|nr:AEC family transporter [Gammaproteobacteria bacterium]
MGAIFTVVLPVFALIAAGCLAGSRGLLGNGAAEVLNGFVYYFSLPALFFNALAQTPLADVFRVPFALSFLGGAVVCAALS